jgi:hypothetical protein
LRQAKLGGDIDAAAQALDNQTQDTSSRIDAPYV